MNEPTQVQVREFWEGYGVEVEEDVYHGDFPDQEGYETIVYLPKPIDLNNLFKYAVPIAIEIIMTKIFKNISLEKAREAFLMFWLKEWDRSEDPALALFWALDKVRKEVRNEI